MVKVEPSHQTILGWLFAKVPISWKLAVIIFFPNFTIIYIKEGERQVWLSYGNRLLSITSLLAVIYSSENSIHSLGHAEAYLEPSGTSTIGIFCENS